jgi:hypothetical protein
VPSEFDEWPDEPDEPDPESRWDDPEDDLVSIPNVEEVDPGSEGAGIEADGEIARFFWVSVIYANVALGGISVGVLLVAFRGQVTVGGIAVAVGLLALYRTYDIYQRYQNEVVDSEDSDTDGTSGGGDRREVENEDGTD